MSPCFQIVEGKAFHCRRIARVLRYEHQRHLFALNVDVVGELRSIFNGSYYRRAWLIDGQLAGLGGVEGSWASTSGRIWLALSERATKYPVAIMRELKRQLEEISLTKKELFTTVIEGDTAAHRLAVHVGFHPAGEGPSGQAYSKAGRRSVLEYIANEPSLRRPAGGSYQVGLVWHPERVDHVVH